MKERPILFNAPMVRALLDGTKTQTRRVVKPEGADHIMQFIGSDDQPTGEWGWCVSPRVIAEHIFCPYGKPGDRLWVREAWKAHTTFDHLAPRDIPQTHVWYMADDGYKAQSRYRNSMFMPRWASRITLDITSIRVERLHDISRGDAMAEGCPFTNMAKGLNPRQWYADLWGQINGPVAWDLNPWVWVVEFKCAEGGAA